MSTVRLRKAFIFFLVIFGCSKEDSPVDNTPNQITYELSVSSSDGGSVDISGGTYNQNSEVTITATPAPGYAFSGWSGNATGSTNPLTVTMTGDKTITANFNRITFGLNVGVVGQGTVSKELISSSKTDEYNQGSVVRLNASSEAPWLFIDWSGASTATTNQIDLTIDSSKSVTATFEERISQVLNPDNIFNGVGKWKIRRPPSSNKSQNCQVLEIIFRNNNSFTIITSAATITGQFTVDSNTTISLSQQNSAIGQITNLILTNSFISFTLNLSSVCDETLDGDRDDNYNEETDSNRVTYIPDNNFEQALIDFGYDDIIDNYVLTRNIENVTGQLSLHQRDIVDITGIDGFKSIEEVYLVENRISSLIIPHMENLQRVIASNNEIIEVDLSQNPQLTSLVLSRNNSLEEIDLSTLINLTNFSCSSCNLNSLDISNNELLEILDVGVLGYLGCPEDEQSGFCTNHIPTIDFSNNNRLQKVNLEGNKQIENIDVSNLLSLESLQIQNVSSIRALDISNNPNLTSLNIGGTSIENIDLSNQPRLLRFNGTRSLLRNLDISNNLEIGSFVITQAPNFDCIKVAPFHLENQFYNGTINGSNTYDGGYEILIWYDDDVLVGLTGCAEMSLDSNGITVLCPDAEPGNLGILNGKTYEVVDNQTLYEKVHNGEDLTCICTSMVTTLAGLFFNNQTFNQNISSWDVSAVNDMSMMFSGASSFNQSLGAWDVSNVSNMQSLFYNATEFNQPIGSWDVSNVTNMRYMFQSFPASGEKNKFNQDISSWDVSNVVLFEGMFYNSNFNQSIGQWDVSKATSLRAMFEYTSFNQDISEWDTSNVTDMSYMFNEASDFNQILNSWNTSSVTNMRLMFRDANSFNQELSSWNTSNVTNMSFMFSGARNFNSNIINWDTSRVTNMDAMFQVAEEFNQDISNWNVSSAISMNFMFYGASNFSQDLSNWCVQNILEEPTSFIGVNSSLDQNSYPLWGTCPGD